MSMFPRRSIYFDMSLTQRPYCKDKNYITFKIPMQYEHDLYMPLL